MIPRILIDTASVPGASAGADQLRLMQRGDEFSIMLGGNELMNSRLSGSEKALATLVCDRIGNRPDFRMLIGGLGMGFTLRAALDVLQPDAHVEVAELVPAVVAWARGPMAHIFGASMTDRRVNIWEGDVGAIIMQARVAYDAILLDVDNGPDGLTRQSNDRLYGAVGLAAARAALRPGGIFAIWSSSPSTVFSQRLRDAGLSVEEVLVRARKNQRGARHVIWLATTPHS